MSKSGSGGIIFNTIFVFIVCLAVVQCFKYGAEQKIAEAPDPLNLPRSVCQDFVKNQLHDPKGAEFDYYQTYYAAQLKDGSYEVQVTLRARNAFNALRHTTFTCKVKNDGQWKLLRLKQI